MRYPLASFSIALVIWFFLLAIFSYRIFKESQILPAAIEIDATMIGEFIREKKTLTKTEENFFDANEKNEIPSSNSASEISQKKLIPLHQPLPKIPDDLRNEAFNSKAIARFFIAADGSVIQVELIQPCANPRLNHLLLKSLKDWKFPQVNGGKASTQDISVHFKVE